MATTTKQFYVKETKITESGKPDKYKGWELKEVPTASAITDVATSTSATAAANATAINAILAALRAAGIVANS